MAQIAMEKCLQELDWLSDNFVGPYENMQAATAANGGAYPPDMSVLVS